MHDITMRRIIHRGIQQSDVWVVALDYIDSKGVCSRRVISPIRFLGRDRFLALCLCREEPRQFYLDRCRNVHLVPAAEVLMPVPMIPVPAPALEEV